MKDRLINIKYRLPGLSVSARHKNVLGRYSASSGHITKLDNLLFLDIYVLDAYAGKQPS
jgi:hypothetical protein